MGQWCTIKPPSSPRIRHTHTCARVQTHKKHAWARRRKYALLLHTPTPIPATRSSPPQLQARPRPLAGGLAQTFCGRVWPRAKDPHTGPTNCSNEWTKLNATGELQVFISASPARWAECHWRAPLASCRPSAGSEMPRRAKRAQRGGPSATGEQTGELARPAQWPEGHWRAASPARRRVSPARWAECHRRALRPSARTDCRGEPEKRDDHARRNGPWSR